VARAQALALPARAGGAQAERLVLEYLPLTFSRRHGDPSRPWNKFSIRVRDSLGRRVVNYEGNWRDIFQNWEALVASEPAYAGSMITAFLGAMTPDGYNPYRIGRDGIDWEVIEADNPWSHIGYWGDHQVVYLLRCWKRRRPTTPGCWPTCGTARCSASPTCPTGSSLTRADRPAQAHHHLRRRGQCPRPRAPRPRVGADGLLVCDDSGEPVLATLGEKLAIILLAKAGSLLPGGGPVAAHPAAGVERRQQRAGGQRAVGGDAGAPAALAGLRAALPGPSAPSRWPPPRCRRCRGSASWCGHAAGGRGRRCGAARFLDSAGAVARPLACRGVRRRRGSRAGASRRQGLLTGLARDLLPLVDATLQRAAAATTACSTATTWWSVTSGRAEVTRLYPMLEGQVAMLSCGLLDAGRGRGAARRLVRQRCSARRRSFLLYPDRRVAGLPERNRLDDAALALPVVQRLLAEGAPTCCSSKATARCASHPACPTEPTWKPPAADLGASLRPGRGLRAAAAHHEFTGRSGTMFAYEGLGCIYWHMVAKLLLAVQEQVFAAADVRPRNCRADRHYRRVRDGLGYRKSAAEYGAFPADPYSHTAGKAAPSSRA
jgi:hypothetical protein